MRAYRVYFINSAYYWYTIRIYCSLWCDAVDDDVWHSRWIVTDRWDYRCWSDTCDCASPLSLRVVRFSSLAGCLMWNRDGEAATAAMHFVNSAQLIGNCANRTPSNDDYSSFGAHILHMISANMAYNSCARIPFLWHLSICVWVRESCVCTCVQVSRRHVGFPARRAIWRACICICIWAVRILHLRTRSGIQNAHIFIETYLCSDSFVSVRLFGRSLLCVILWARVRLWVYVHTTERGMMWGCVCIFTPNKRASPCWPRGKRGRKALCACERLPESPNTHAHIRMSYIARCLSITHKPRCVQCLYFASAIIEGTHVVVWPATWLANQAPELVREKYYVNACLHCRRSSVRATPHREHTHMHTPMQDTRHVCTQMSEWSAKRKIVCHTWRNNSHWLVF